MSPHDSWEILIGVGWTIFVVSFLLGLFTGYGDAINKMREWANNTNGYFNGHVIMTPEYLKQQYIHRGELEEVLNGHQ